MTSSYEIVKIRPAVMSEEFSGVFSKRNARNVRNVSNVMKWRNYWIGQSQPPATTAYAAAKLWQTRAKLLKFNLICIVSCTTSKKRTKIWSIDLKKNFNLKFSWKERTARFLLAGACVSYVSFVHCVFLRFLRCLRCFYHSLVNEDFHTLCALRWMETPL